MFDDSIIELLNSLDEGIMVIDSNGIISFINKKIAALDNIDPVKAIGRHLLEVYPSLSEENSTLMKVVKNGQAILDNSQSFKNYKGEVITTVNSTIPIRKNRKIIGAIEISKDITNVQKLSQEVVDLKSELVGKRLLEESEIDYKPEKSKGFTFMDIIGQSSEMLKLKAFAIKASGSPSPVLIYGETGTGKELFVQSIHNSSQRKNKPFIAQNCAAIPGTLLEGILFGTVKGSFTGAEDRMGLFEIADGGTLYLDELNSMPMELQAKLLRVIQDGMVRRVGDLSERKVDVRIIASTNVDPAICVKEGIIRTDLYYRLNVISLKIPELKNRKSDIPMLIDFFITKYNSRLNMRIRGIAKDALECLISYDWPGNVRELEHVIESIMNLKESSFIEMEDLPDNIRNRNVKGLSESIDEFEKKMIVEALKLWDKNISKTADYLRIPRQTLQYKLKKYGIG